jgi:hypothetical protein
MTPKQLLQTLNDRIEAVAPEVIIDCYTRSESTNLDKIQERVLSAEDVTSALEAYIISVVSDMEPREIEEHLQERENDRLRNLNYKYL